MKTPARADANPLRKPAAAAEVSSLVKGAASGSDAQSPGADLLHRSPRMVAQRARFAAAFGGSTHWHGVPQPAPPQPCEVLTVPRSAPQLPGAPPVQAKFYELMPDGSYAWHEEDPDERLFEYTGRTYGRPWSGGFLAGLIGGQGDWRSWEVWRRKGKAAKSKPKSEKQQRAEVSVRSAAPLRQNQVKAQVAQAVTEARKDLNVAKKMEAGVDAENEHATLLERLNATAELSPPDQRELEAARDSAVVLEAERGRFRSWFCARTVERCRQRVMMWRGQLETVEPIQRYLPAGDVKRLESARAELERLLRLEAAVKFDTLAPLFERTSSALAAAESVFSRLSTADLVQTVRDLGVAEGNFNRDWVAGVIEDCAGLAEAQAALNYCGQATHLAPFQALLATFRPRLARLAFQEACPALLITTLAGFELREVPQAGTVELPVRAGYDLSVGRRLCSFRWVHFLDAHHFAHATAAVLLARDEEVTTFWSPGTTTANIQAHIGAAMQAHPNIVGIYAAIAAGSDRSFDPQDIPLPGGGPTVRIRLEVKGGFVTITQFYPRNGAGLIRFTREEINLLGRLLSCHR